MIVQVGTGGCIPVLKLTPVTDVASTCAVVFLRVKV